MAEIDVHVSLPSGQTINSWLLDNWPLGQVVAALARKLGLAPPQPGGNWQGKLRDVVSGAALSTGSTLSEHHVKEGAGLRLCSVLANTTGTPVAPDGTANLPKWSAKTVSARLALLGMMAVSVLSVVVMALVIQDRRTVEQAANAGLHAESGRTTVTPEVDTDYILALSAADSFLAAWQNRDANVGFSLLSPRFQKTIDLDDWKSNFTGVSNPHNEAYEISRGVRRTDGRLVFDVWMYTHYWGERSEVSRRGAPQRIVLIKVSAEQWKVDESPV